MAPLTSKVNQQSPLNPIAALELQSPLESLNPLAVSDAMISGIDLWYWGFQWVFDR
jgi:hypothetical protein